MNKHINIDGKIMNQICKKGYKKEVFERLRYAQVIIQETNQKLIGTNFESLLRIIKESCDQLQSWINEYKKEQLEKNQ